MRKKNTPRKIRSSVSLRNEFITEELPVDRIAPGRTIHCCVLIDWAVASRALIHFRITEAERAME